MAQGEFIDLYELLGMPVESDIPALRKRLSEIYIEAQNNLDHRNAQKRLQYQQMYELYLPQARHLLLDAGRRAEYDRYLIAFRSGKPLSQVEARPVATVAAPLVADIPEMSEAEERIDPAVLAAQREQLWDKWKSSLETSEPGSNGDPGTTASTATASATPAAATPAARPAHAAPSGGNGRAARASTPGAGTASPGATSTARPGTYVAVRRPVADGPAAADEAEKQRRAEFERQRETQRAEMMANLAQTTWLYWAFGIGAGSLLGLCIILLLVESVLSSTGKYPVMGLSSGTFSAVGFGIAVVVAVAAAFIGSGLVRSRTLDALSRLPFEELQRRAR